MKLLEAESRSVAFPTWELTDTRPRSISGVELQGDRLLRTIPAWGVLKWQVTALQTFAGRAAQEREVVKELKKGAQMKSQPQRSS